MERKLTEYSHLDPEVWVAQSTALKLFDEYKSSQDPLTKKIFKNMVFDALEYEAKLKLKSQVKEAVQNLHNLQNPEINPN